MLVIRKFTNKCLRIRIIVRNFTNKFRHFSMQNKKVYTEKQERMARFAKALGHPARIAIMQFLARQKQCYFGDIHEELPIAKATVSQHLTELKDAGLIQGTIEIPKVKYCINRDNWMLAKMLFQEFLNQEMAKSDCGCNKQSNNT